MDKEMMFSHDETKNLEKVPLCKDKNYRHRPSSFHMQSPEGVFKSLDLKPGQFILDLGCGVGDYSLYAEKIIGSSGMIYAIDANEEAIEIFNQEIIRQNIRNITTIVENIQNPFNLEDNIIDVCYIATVLHSPQNFENSGNFFKEIQRVLKPQGKLAILEIKKEPTPFGPPMNMRISPSELIEVMKTHGFNKIEHCEFEHSYLTKFNY